MNWATIAHPLLALALAPLLPGIIARVKACFGGRRGQPLLQLYADLGKLLRKGAVYSRTTTWVFRVAPLVGLAAAVPLLTLLPAGGGAALLSFPGDLILLTGLLALWRFATTLAALDTGSAFAGMGASREAAFAALAEPVLFLSLAALMGAAGTPDLELYRHLSGETWLASGPALALVGAALLAVFLAENSRIPIDDPTTHLELTMIHEAMILDYCGPDLAFILYAASLKLWILGTLLVGLLLPAGGLGPWPGLLLHLGGLALLAVVTGVIESVMARQRLPRVPQFLVSAGVLAALALILVLR